MNLTAYQPKNITEDLLHLITINTSKHMQQTQTKAQET